MEEVLFEHSPCHVFRVPPENPLTSAKWEGQHIWSGTVRLCRRWQDQHAVHFVELLDVSSSSAPEVFGQCPLPDGASSSFQVAEDSSRCFVVRVEQGDQFAFLGLNFEEKSDALRFCKAVAERHKHMHALQRTLFEQPLVDAAAVSHGPAAAVRADGKFRVDLNGKLASQGLGNAHHNLPGNQPVRLDVAPPSSGISRRIRAEGVASVNSDDGRAPSASCAPPPGAKPVAEAQQPHGASLPSTAAAPNTQMPRRSVEDPFAGLEDVKQPARPQAATLDDLFR